MILHLTTGDELLRKTITGNGATKILDFRYDQSGAPYSLTYTVGSTSTVYYYVTNLQGDVMYLADSSGSQVAAYLYDPYGKVLSSSGTMAEINPLRYRGYYQDSETGFYYLQSRYYDPAICRFINADSYASTGQGLIGYNAFAYCLNNPIDKFDTTGSIAITTAILIGSVVLGLIAGGITAYTEIKADCSTLQVIGDSITAACSVFLTVYTAGLSIYACYQNYCYLNALQPKTNIGVKPSDNPLGSINYTPKVRGQAAKDDFHGFPEAVDAFGGDGIMYQQIGADGEIYTHLEIAGSYKGYDGVFEYIWDVNRSCNHRIFRPEMTCFY